MYRRTIRWGYESDRLTEPEEPSEARASRQPKSTNLGRGQVQGSVTGSIIHPKSQTEADAFSRASPTVHPRICPEVI